MKADELFASLGLANRFIPVQKDLVENLGLYEAVVFSELVTRYIYFLNRNQLTKDGYFFNTVNDLKNSIGLSGHQQNKALKKLKEAGLIKMTLRGLPKKRYFKINTNIDISKLDQPQEITHLLKNQMTSYEDMYSKYRIMELKSSVKEYLKVYEEAKGKAHPRIRKSQFYSLAQNLLDFMEEKDLDSEYMSELVEKYFKAKLATDHNIIHFSQHGILENRFYEADFNH